MQKHGYKFEERDPEFELPEMPAPTMTTEQRRGVAIKEAEGRWGGVGGVGEKQRVKGVLNEYISESAIGEEIAGVGFYSWFQPHIGGNTTLSFLYLLLLLSLRINVSVYNYLLRNESFSFLLSIWCSGNLT